MSRRDERAFSTASSTFCPEIFRLFQSWALIIGMLAEIPAFHVFHLPTSMPPPVGKLGFELSVEPESVEPESVVPPVLPSPSDDPPPMMLLMSISIYITCFLIVLWNAPVRSICGKRDA